MNQSILDSESANMTTGLGGFTPEELVILASPSTSWALVWLCVMVIIVTTCANLTVIVCFLYNPHLRKPFNYLLVNLAVSDLLCGALAMSHLCVYTYYTYWPLGTRWCSIWLYFDWLSVNMGLLTIAFISMDRMWAAIWPLTYRKYNTVRKSWIIICVSWIIGNAGLLPGQIYNHMYLSAHYGRFKCYWAFDLQPVYNCFSCANKRVLTVSSKYSLYTDLSCCRFGQLLFTLFL